MGDNEGMAGTVVGNELERPSRAQFSGGPGQLRYPYPGLYREPPGFQRKPPNVGGG